MGHRTIYSFLARMNLCTPAKFLSTSWVRPDSERNPRVCASRNVIKLRTAGRLFEACKLDLPLIRTAHFAHVSLVRPISCQLKHTPPVFPLAPRGRARILQHAIREKCRLSRGIRTVPGLISNSLHLCLCFTCLASWMASCKLRTSPRKTHSSWLGIQQSWMVAMINQGWPRNRVIEAMIWCNHTMAGSRQWMSMMMSGAWIVPFFLMTVRDQTVREIWCSVISMTSVRSKYLQDSLHSLL